MTSVSLTAQPSQSYSSSTLSTRDIPKSFTSYTVNQAATEKLVPKPSRIRGFFRKLASFFIKLCPCNRQCLQNPATKDRIRLAAITIATLLGIFALLFSLGFGLGCILLTSIPNALIFAGCVSITPQICASLYVPLLLQERYPCRPYKASSLSKTTAAPATPPVPPKFWGTINRQLEHLKACNGEDIAALYRFAQELENFHYLATSAPYRQAAEWLENLLKQNPSLATRLKTYSRQLDDRFLKDIHSDSQLSIDTIENILNFLKTGLSTLSADEIARLNRILASQTYSHLSTLYTKASDFICTNTDQSQTLNESKDIHEMIDCVYQLRQCMMLDRLTTGFQPPHQKRVATDLHKRANVLFKQLKTPLLNYCQNHDIQWAKIPLAKAINQALPLVTQHTFTHRHLKCPITCDEIENVQNPVINLIDQYLYEREALEEWLLTHSTSPMNRKTCTKADLIDLKDLIKLTGFKIKTVFK